ncbi:hypothetical protein ON010_g10980 [Phytophthora cinnamomi]|nr:hypothetical protein ON010_g10980 [Phytophthora cinnamomi]
MTIFHVVTNSRPQPRPALALPGTDHDMVNTLLHEMIHAYVFVATPVRDHEDHGPLFQAHMNRINQAANTQITVFHTFHDEVDSYRQHVWQCNGPCRRTPPYFGLVKRAMNRAPGPTDRWWADHEQSCGGSYTKVKEPAEFTAKQAKKKQRELAREQKQEKKKKAKTAPSVNQFFPMIEEDVGAGEPKKTARDTKPPRVGKKTPSRIDDDNDRHKKRKTEAGNDSSSNAVWPMLGFPSAAPVVFAADGEEDGYFLVGDIQALFQTQPTKPFTLLTGSRNQQEPSRVLRGPSTGDSATVVDLTVSGSDISDNEHSESRGSFSLATVPQATSETVDPNIIEID